MSLGRTITFSGGGEVEQFAPEKSCTAKSTGKKIGQRRPGGKKSRKLLLSRSFA